MTSRRAFERRVLLLLMTAVVVLRRRLWRGLTRLTGTYIHDART